MSQTEHLEVCDDMTIYRAEAQKQLLMDALARASTLALDLSQINEIDTAGLQLLMLVKRETVLQEKTLRIVACSPTVQQLFAFCNLTSFFGDSLLSADSENR